MNEVYLRGKLVSVYDQTMTNSQTKHLVYQLQVSHKNAQHQVKIENYTVNAWRNLANWAAANLQIGMNVFVRGYLTQRRASDGTMTEITAQVILPIASEMHAFKQVKEDNCTVPAQQTPSPEVCMPQAASET